MRRSTLPPGVAGLLQPIKKKKNYWTKESAHTQTRTQVAQDPLQQQMYSALARVNFILKSEAAGSNGSPYQAPNGYVPAMAYSAAGPSGVLWRDVTTHRSPRWTTTKEQNVTLWLSQCEYSLISRSAKEESAGW